MPRYDRVGLTSGAPLTGIEARRCHSAEEDTMGDKGPGSKSKGKKKKAPKKA
jgi:hypothetical protein